MEHKEHIKKIMTGIAGLANSIHSELQKRTSELEKVDPDGAKKIYDVMKEQNISHQINELNKMSEKLK